LPAAVTRVARCPPLCASQSESGTLSFGTATSQPRVVLPQAHHVARHATRNHLNHNRASCLYNVRDLCLLQAVTAGAHTTPQVCHSHTHTTYDTPPPTTGADDTGLPAQRTRPLLNNAAHPPHNKPQQPRLPEVAGSSHIRYRQLQPNKLASQLQCLCAPT
jgi:hypothetical protein